MTVTALTKEVEDYPALVRRAKLRLLRMHYENQVGHIGGNLSALDVTLFLHHRAMEADDSFVLSKGHAAGALYVTLWTIGRLSDAQLDQFHRDGSMLAGHPPAGWNPGIPLATGSLGHGLPMAAGIALGKKLTGAPGRVYCLTSDGEWEEGSNWEALIFARHQRLDRLTLLVDANGLQGFGTCREVASLEPLRDRFEGFGVPVHEADGHDPAAIAEALSRSTAEFGVIILHTVKGKGVSFMENKLEWHYLQLTDELYERALKDLELR